jgi:hypothetical protein
MSDRQGLNYIKKNKGKNERGGQINICRLGSRKRKMRFNRSTRLQNYAEKNNCQRNTSKKTKYKFGKRQCGHALNLFHKNRFRVIPKTANKPHYCSVYKKIMLLRLQSAKG